jgi:hypothetical protein
MSTNRSLIPRTLACSRCLRPWQSTNYRTCRDCRTVYVQPLPNVTELHPTPSLTSTRKRRRLDTPLALPSYKDARKPLPEVERRGDIRHNAGLPDQTCDHCGASNYARLSYDKDPKRFWCCDGGSTELPLLGDYPDLLKALLTETVPTSTGRLKRSPNVVGPLRNACCPLANPLEMITG